MNSNFNEQSELVVFGLEFFSAHVCPYVTVRKFRTPGSLPPFHAFSGRHFCRKFFARSYSTCTHRISTPAYGPFREARVFICCQSNNHAELSEWVHFWGRFYACPDAKKMFPIYYFDEIQKMHGHASKINKNDGRRRVHFLPYSHILCNVQHQHCAMMRYILYHYLINHTYKVTIITKRLKISILIKTTLCEASGSEFS